MKYAKSGIFAACLFAAAMSASAAEGMAASTTLPDGSVVTATTVTNIATPGGFDTLFAGDVVISKDGIDRAVSWAMFDAAAQSVHTSAVKSLFCSAGVLTWGGASQGVRLEHNPFYPPDQPRMRAWCTSDRIGQTDLGHFNRVAMGLG